MRQLCNQCVFEYGMLEVVPFIIDVEKVYKAVYVTHTLLHSIDSYI